MRIVVIGAGFAGRAAVGQLKDLPEDIEVLLFDKNSYTAMLPSLPDYAGFKLDKKDLIEDIAQIIPPKIKFVQAEVIKINFALQTVTTQQNTYPFDYAVIALGSKTNFFGFRQNLSRIYKLDSVAEGTRLRHDFRQALEQNNTCHVVFSGGGFTGLELLTSLHFYACQKRKKIKLTLVELKDEILNLVNIIDRLYVKEYLARLGVDIIYNNKITEFNGQDVELANGQKIENVMLCWTAGMQFPLSTLIGNVKQLPDDRLQVNDYLQVEGYASIFAAGDSAAIKLNDRILRRAVNFSVYSGIRAGDNIKKMIKQQKLKKFHPFDLGWIISLSQSSLGRVFNKIPVKGKIGLRLRYLITAYRNYNLKKFLFFLKKAITL
jgi:NADH dehydrogenase